VGFWEDQIVPWDWVLGRGRRDQIVSRYKISEVSSYLVYPNPSLAVSLDVFRIAAF
jgi:hypothetical protein